MDELADLVLHKDTPNSSWGFRMQGGVDFDCELMVQRVFIGSPSEGELHRGDVIVSVQGVAAANLKHHEADELIRRAGSTLSLRVRRVGAAGQYGCPLVPHHSAAYGGDNYQHSPQPTYQHSPQPAYQQAPQPAYQQAPQPTYQQAPQPTYHQAPQPTYQHSPQATYQPSYQPAATSQPASHYATQPRRRQQPGYRPSVPTPRKEMFDVRAETEKERNAILGQPFRSRQLIAPTVKPTWDYPCGSYLDAQRRGPTEVVNREPEQEMHPNPKPLFPQQPAKTAWVQAQPPPSQPSPKFTLPSTGKPFVLQTDDKNKQIVHAQFNSPLNIYSTENVVDTIQGQTGYRPLTATESPQASSGAFVPSATMRAVYEDEAYTTGGALQVQEAEPYQSKSVKQLQSMYS